MTHSENTLSLIEKLENLPGAVSWGLVLREQVIALVNEHMGDASTRKDEAACVGSPTIGDSPSEILDNDFEALIDDLLLACESPPTGKKVRAIFKRMLRPLIRNPKPVSLEKCATAVCNHYREGEEKVSSITELADWKQENHWEIAKAVLNAAGVEYHED